MPTLRLNLKPYIPKPLNLELLEPLTRNSANPQLKHNRSHRKSKGHKFPSETLQNNYTIAHTHTMIHLV